MDNGSTEFVAENETQAVFQVQAQGKILEPYLELVPTGNTSPEVTFIEVFFE